MGQLWSDCIGRKLCDELPSRYSLFLFTEPVTSVVPTQDLQTLLVASLDNHIRLMDSSTGKMLNEFQGHVNESYRCRACFGHGEATVICGDEKGQLWAWDLVDVGPGLTLFMPLIDSSTGRPAPAQSTSKGTPQSHHMDGTPSGRGTRNVNRKRRWHSEGLEAALITAMKRTLAVYLDTAMLLASACSNRSSEFGWPRRIDVQNRSRTRVSHYHCGNSRQVHRLPWVIDSIFNDSAIFSAAKVGRDYLSWWRPPAVACRRVLQGAGHNGRRSRE